MWLRCLECCANMVRGEKSLICQRHMTWHQLSRWQHCFWSHLYRDVFPLHHRAELILTSLNHLMISHRRKPSCGMTTDYSVPSATNTPEMCMWRERTQTSSRTDPYSFYLKGWKQYWEWIYGSVSNISRARFLCVPYSQNHIDLPITFLLGFNLPYEDWLNVHIPGVTSTMTWYLPSASPPQRIPIQYLIWK